MERNYISPTKNVHLTEYINRAFICEKQSFEKHS